MTRARRRRTARDDRANGGGTQTRPGRAFRLRRSVVLGGVLLVGCASSSTDVFTLQVGDCIQDPDTTADEIREVGSVDCEEPHDNEVYAVFELPDGDFPGADAISEASLDGCLGRFEDVVGTPYPASELYATWLLPTESSWGEGDREVVCLLFAQGEQLEGSMEGSGR